MDQNYTETYLKHILKNASTVAVVGASDNPQRASYDVMKFLISQGYEVIPVNPRLAGKAVHGQTAVASLRDITRPVDIVDIFRRPEHVPEVVDEAIEIGAKAIWMQLGVVHEEAARKAQAAGLDVVMDRCMKIELSCLNS
ncbi:MAG: CoA-binding protein [Alphaproteobacteria bacterium]